MSNGGGVHCMCGTPLPPEILRGKTPKHYHRFSHVRFYTRAPPATPKYERHSYRFTSTGK